MSSEVTAARRALWLQWLRSGETTAAIARMAGVSRRTVQYGIAAARKAEEAAPPRPSVPVPEPPRLVPLFPISSFTPGSECGHRGPVRAGSVLCCMVCHASGIDDHPGLRRDPRTDPRPEPRPPAPAKPGAPETRRQRRARQFAGRSAAGRSSPSAAGACR